MKGWAWNYIISATLLFFFPIFMASTLGTMGLTVSIWENGRFWAGSQGHQQLKIPHHLGSLEKILLCFRVRGNGRVGRGLISVDFWGMWSWLGMGHDDCFDALAWLDCSPQFLSPTLISRFYCDGIFQMESKSLISWLELKEMVLDNLSGPALTSWKTLQRGLRYPQNREGIPPLHNSFHLYMDFQLPSLTIWPMAMMKYSNYYLQLESKLTQSK